MAVKKRERVNLHETLMRRSYDHGVICTYSFDPTFFEDYCLEKFNCLTNNANLTVVVDRGIYEKAILGAVSDKPSQANIRYLLHPVSVSGTFHAKLFLFVSGDRGRLILGSANFTRPGITSNAEMVACYDYDTDKDEFFKPIFQRAYAFLVELTKRYPGNAFSSNVQAISRDATWLSLGDEVPDLANMEFIHNLDMPLWDQLVSRVNSSVNTVDILSRYFDSSPDVLTKLQADLSPKRIRIFTQNGITTLNRNWLRHPLVQDGTAQILLCTYSDGGYVLPLHAKAIALQTNHECILSFGSANFTTSAMFSSAHIGNVETLVVIRGATDQIDPEKLFDPQSSALCIKNEALLQSAPSEDEYSVAGVYEISLSEANLVGERILLTANIPAEIVYQKLSAILTFDDNAQQSLAISIVDGDNYSVIVSGEIVQRLGKSSTIIQIEASRDEGETVARSNPILVTNLIDIHSGQNVRRERHIREAEQSTMQFFAVLKDLIALGDERDLIVFLNYCDIPITDALRPVFARGARPVWNGGLGMRYLGERNLTLFANLHDAAVFFFDHHLRKLEHHINHGSVNGIPNFMHIFLAMGSILRAQVERIVQGLESMGQPLSAHDWFAYREHFNVYFMKFRKSMNCLCGEYLPKITRNYGPDEVTKRLDPDVAPLRDLCSDMLGFRERIESLRHSKLKVKTEDGHLVIPRYYNCILSGDRWPEVASAIEGMLASVEKLLTASEINQANMKR